MTLNDFETRLKKINPNFIVRKRGHRDAGGIFLGTEYIVRFTQGELNLNGYRYRYFSPNGMSYNYGNIEKRGRKTIVKMLEARHLIKNLEQRASLLWGI